MSAIPPHKIIRSHRRTITLHITPQGEFVVHAPHLVPKFFIDKFIHEKKDWITKKISEVQKRPRMQPKKFIDGDKVLYLGKNLPLRLVDSISIQPTEAEFLFPKALLFRAKKELENWYIQQAKKIITERVKFHAEKMRASYKSLLFSDTKSKWGTCFHDNSLQFSWRLIMAPLMVIDYVIIHELTHTTEKNHSRSFWNRVRLFTPAYRQHREWLNKHGHMMLA